MRPRDMPYDGNYAPPPTDRPLPREHGQKHAETFMRKPSTAPRESPEAPKPKGRWVQFAMWVED